MNKLTEKQEFRISPIQKETLRLLHDKYGINTSQFIRESINEKLLRDKNNVFKKFNDIQKYLLKINNCPF